jgi:delta-aminolevulinic acid dehydratase/porphobilinogen synthase
MTKDNLSLDEKIDNLLDRVYLLEPKAIVSPSKIVTGVTQSIKQLITEARIEELEWVKSRSAKHAGIFIDPYDSELHDRIKELKGEV